MQRFHELLNSSIRPRRRLIGKQNRERMITARDLKLRFERSPIEEPRTSLPASAIDADMIAHANFQRVITGNQLARINQSRERQPLTGVTVAAPVLSLLAEFLAIFDQRVFDID